jgi:hypothetical protein
MFGPSRLALIQAMLAGISALRGERRVAKGRASKKLGRKRLRMARGAGSINCKADALQQCRAGRWREAAEMVREHRRQCGEHLFDERTLQAWADREPLL